MTVVDDLKTRRAAVAAELAALSTSTAGGLPNVQGGGDTDVDHQGYKKGLYEELQQLDQAIARAEIEAAAAAGDVGVYETEEWP